MKLPTWRDQKNKALLANAVVLLAALAYNATLYSRLANSTVLFG